MERFRKYAEDNWLTIPKNTQLVERWVKDANECTFNIKDESLADAIAILRSTTIFRFRRKALQLSQQRVLSANQHRTAGKVGVWINKNTGELDREKNVDQIRGAFYNNLVIYEVLREVRQLSRLRTPQSDCKHLLGRLHNTHMSFQKSRTNATLISYTSTMASPIPTPNNATVDARCFEVTDHMKGRYAIGNLIKFHLHLIREEIVHRGDEVDSNMGIIIMSECLKRLEAEQQRKVFRERTGNSARDEDLNRDSFKPHVRTATYNALLEK